MPSFSRTIGQAIRFTSPPDDEWLFLGRAAQWSSFPMGTLLELGSLMDTFRDLHGVRCVDSGVRAPEFICMREGAPLAHMPTRHDAAGSAELDA
jgi:hypothetical protein